MIKRTYYCMCDECGTVLKDGFGQFDYRDRLNNMVDTVTKSGWKVVEQPDKTYKDYCEKCK